MAETIQHVGPDRGVERAARCLNQLLVDGHHILPLLGTASMPQSANCPKSKSQAPLGARSSLALA